MTSKKHVFTILEKKSFTEILKKYSTTIENKDTDGASLRAKNEAWNSVTQEYNASPHTTMEMTSRQLRRLWMNLKQRQRGSKERQNREATGGGQTISDAVIDPDVSEIARALIIGVKEAIDSDTLPESVQIVLETRELPRQESLTISQTPSSSTTQPPPLIEPPDSLTPLPPPPYSLTPPSPSTPLSSTSFQRQNNTILKQEFGDRQRWPDELHTLEKELMKHRLREDKAKADLAEYLLKQKCSAETEYRDRQRRPDELHMLEIELMKHRVREAKAKADLAEYILQEKCSANISSTVDRESME